MRFAQQREIAIDTRWSLAYHIGSRIGRGVRSVQAAVCGECMDWATRCGEHTTEFDREMGKGAVCLPFRRGVQNERVVTP